MARESVATEADEATDLNAITEWHADIAWDWLAMRGQLPVGVANRLKRVDRMLCGANKLHEMIQADIFGRFDAEDSGANYKPLNGVDRLMLAAAELGRSAEELLEEIRAGDFDLSIAQPKHVSE